MVVPGWVQQLCNLLIFLHHVVKKWPQHLWACPSQMRTSKARRKKEEKSELSFFSLFYINEEQNFPQWLIWGSLPTSDSQKTSLYMLFARSGSHSHIYISCVPKGIMDCYIGLHQFWFLPWHCVWGHRKKMGILLVRRIE